MLKAIIAGERRASLVETDTPHPKSNWVVVKVHAAPMCTEYKSFVTGQEAHFLGHEAAGEVVEIAQPGCVEVGDRVVVMPSYPCGRCALCVAGDYIHCEASVDVTWFTGCAEGSATYAQYLIKPDWLLPAIPDGVTYERASLACCGLGPSFGAFNEMRLDRFDTVLITGAGPVGLGAVINARFRGARVIVAEYHSYRVRKALELGAEHVVDPRDPEAVQQIRTFTGGVGVDKAIDCAGVVAAQRLCIDATRRRGAVALVGECMDELPIRASVDMIRKGLTLHGVWHYNLSLFPKIMQVIQGSPCIDGLISHVLPMSCIQEAFEIAASHDCAKIILKPWE